MQKNQVKVGGVYSAKVTDKVVPVRIDAVNARGGWDATNMKTHRKVRIKSAAKLRGEVKVPGAVSTAKAEAPVKSGEPKLAKKKLTTAERRSAAGDGKTKSKAAPKEKKLSLLSAAAQILADAKEPMNCKQIVEQVTAKKLWAPRNGGKTPHATLYAAMTREIAAKGKDARFVKVERGHFTSNIKKGA